MTYRTAVPRAASQRLPTTQCYYPTGRRLCRPGDAGSHGSRNRQAIAVREARVATRLRAYQKATEREAAPGPPNPATALRSAGHLADREIELE